MVDYVSLLKEDLAEQFRGKEHIESLMEVLGNELQEAYDFLRKLLDERDVYTAVGKQLDGVGNIVDMTRMEAGKLAGNPIPYDIIDDEIYRQFLIFKILKNNCNCTYPDIVKAFRMFWDRPLYYTEDPEQPATMIFSTGEMQGFVDTRPLFRTPPIRAAGVTLKLYAITSTSMEPAMIRILSGLGYATTVSDLPVLERDYHFQSQLYVSSGFGTVSEDTLPVVERAYNFGFRLRLGANHSSVTHDIIPEPAIVPMPTTKVSGDGVYSIMETPISGIALQE